MADQNLSAQDSDRKLDEMLDGLLAEYSAAGPRPGLETRILASVREESEAAKDESSQPGWRWTFAWMRVGMWAAAAVATAAILVAIYFSRPQSRAPQIVQHPRQQEAPSPVEQRGPAPGPKVNASGQTPPSGGTQRVQNTADSTRQVVAIRQEVFPSPSPLSEQEKLLFRYMARTPREELVSQSHPDPPQAEDGGTDLKDGSPNNLTQVQQHSSNTR